MNERRVFVLQELGAMRRGSWRAVLVGADAATARRVAALCCPECSSIGILPDAAVFADGTHSVTADGLVEPALACLAPGCTFHERVRLEGWNG